MFTRSPLPVGDFRRDPSTDARVARYQRRADHYP
jgi:hypothetical protein